MILSLLYLALSLFGLGFLVFIHEYGHFYVGKKMGMKVETFSIGFGKPIKTWHSGGVVFQIGLIPFGGFVKFKGLDGDRSSKDGFYSVPFYKRIFVAFAGPLANLILALLVFLFIFLVGGRHVDFMEKSPFIGYLKKPGFLFNAGAREGDKITTINQKPYKSWHDFMVARTMSKGAIQLTGEHFPFYNQSTFDVTIYDGGFLPSNYLIFEQTPSIVPAEKAYLQKMGLVKGDRLLAVNGQPIFSKTSLVETLQVPSVLLHVKRDEMIIAVKVDKLALQDIKLTSFQQGELTDWMHGASLKNIRYYIPYDLSADLKVENICEFLNQNASWQRPEASDEMDPLTFPLQKGDVIIAASGQAVSTGADLLRVLDEDVVHIIAQKKSHGVLNLQNAIDGFWAPYLSEDFKTLYTDFSVSQSGDLLSFSIPAIRLDQLKLSEQERMRQEKVYQETLVKINQIKDPKQRAYELEELEFSRKRVMIGGKFQDQVVTSNPNPFKELYDACALTFKTIGSLVKGGLSPKQLSGPVAIVGVMQQGAKKSFTEGLYYFAVISVNLALFNLLPLPVLDGGHIIFALYEGIMRKPVPQKVMERLTLIFVIVLVALIIYATYNDILRFIKGLF